MYSRDEFERRRTAAKQLAGRDGRLLAVVSVGLGVVQLLLIRWFEGQLERRSAVAIEGALFLAYIALVGWLVWRMQRELRAARPTCPDCGVVLQGLSDRVAAATGKCDSCGGQVVK